MMRDTTGHPLAMLAAGALALSAGSMSWPRDVLAQGAPSWGGQPAQTQNLPPARPPAQPQPGSQAKQQPKGAPAPAVAGGSEAGLRQRVEQLEEQLVDLQVVVGTVESLARAGGATASTAYRGGVPVGGGSSGADAGRIAALETQVQALTAQLESMAEQLRQMQSGMPRGPSGPAPRGGVSGSVQGSVQGGPPPASGFGATTVTGSNDPIASIINAPDPRGAPPPRVAAGPAGPGAGGPPAMASSPAGRQQYEAAYSFLLQQNYPAAEAGFAEFLQRFPNDELTPNAQFWLGETYFVRGQWDSAAAAFLKVAQSHPRSDKAPDSLAKFAMSMERKGNKPAACRALQELNTRYPSPPAHVRTWEQAERRKAGCA